MDRMPDGLALYQLTSSSAQLHQQELQLRQYTLAAMKAREHEREQVKLSPEPHLEIMRPVSPFQNKRQLAHQQAPSHTAAQTQPQREQRTWNPQQPYAHASRPSHIQEASQSSTSTSTNSHSSSRTGHPNSRTRLHAHNGDSRGSRDTQRSADISPALRMMNYDTNSTPSSSEQGHGRVPGNAYNPTGTLAPPERSDMNRSTSPEGGRKRNAGWRKPVPKYIPTPPSTPPTATFERLPSTREREERAPPVPPFSNSTLNVQPARRQPSPVRSHTEPDPPSVARAQLSRPARAATDHQVPVMFRDLTSETRMATIQKPAQVHTRSHILRQPRNTTTTPKASQASSRQPAPTSATSQLQVPVTPRAPPQAHTTYHDRATHSAAATQVDSFNQLSSNDRNETQRGAIVHQQPRKVPSMAQLVAMVLPSRSQSRSPSRTPSPRIATKDISGPLPLHSEPPAQATSGMLTESSQAVVPSFSVDPPSPVADAGRTAAVQPLSGSLLQPEQVHLPPSEYSSARSSRSTSPQPSPRKSTSPLPTSTRSASPRPSPRSATLPLPTSAHSASPRPSPRRATAPLPVRSRSRSPTPAVIPQYAPPPPPFPPPPPNTPVAAPKTRTSALIQSLLTSNLTQKAELTVAHVQASHVVSTQVVAPEEDVVPKSTRKHSPPSTEASSFSAFKERDTKVYTGVRSESICTRDPKQSSQSSDDRRFAGNRTLDIAGTEQCTAALMVEAYRLVTPATKQGTQAVDVSAKQPTPVGSIRERGLSSRDLTQRKAQPKQANEEPATNDTVVAPLQEEIPLLRNLIQEAIEPTKQVAIPERSNGRSLCGVQDHGVRALGSYGATVQVAPRADNSVNKRPAPMPMSEHADVSRESGLVTPPDTPPGTLASKAMEHHEQSREKDSIPVEQPSSTAAVHVLRLVSPTQLPPNSVPIAKTVVRREALIQDESFPPDDKPAVDEAKVVARPTTPVFTLAASVPVANILYEEPLAPPLPPDWKEAITRVAHSNANPSPSPPVPSRIEDEKSSMLPSMKPTAYSQLQTLKPTDEVSVSRRTVREASIEQIEHATTALELHIHEVETRRVPEANQISEKPIDSEKEQRSLLSSRSPRRRPVALELNSKTEVTAKQPAQDVSVSSGLPSLAPLDLPVRSRSPVPRRKAPQQCNVPACDCGLPLTEERTNAAPSVTAREEAPVFSSMSAVPSARQPGEPSSRNHSSSSKRKGKAVRIRADGEDHNAGAVRSDERPLEEVARCHDAEPPAFKESPSPPSESQALANCISPPPRYQKLGSRKRLLPNGSESNLAEPEDKDFARFGPSSPPAVSRALPPLSQTQPPSRPQRHLHGQHRRLPAPEVTQQAYRPPTPPIPSHYKKKRSNDPLPLEPTNFMKPAVHVIYPDTSNSHGPSLSGDSLFNMSSTKPANNNNRAQPAPTQDSVAYRDVRARPQSHSLSMSASQEEDEDKDEDPGTYPRLPPKTRRTEVTIHGCPSSSDRLPDFTIQHATRGQVRYPSAPVGQARAHILMLPPSSNSSKGRTVDQTDPSPASNLRSRRNQKPHATKAARSQSEKVLRKNDNVRPLERSRSTPIPSSRQGSRRGFWRIFGLWARVFMAKFKNWASPTPSPSYSSEYGGYYDT